MQEKIRNEIINILKVEDSKIKNVKRFLDGMSNYTYFFEISNEKYVIRKIGDGASKYINYENEFEGIKVIFDNQITSELIHFNVENGMKVSRYIEGEPINFAKRNFKIEKLIVSLKVLHNIHTKKINNYSLIKRINEYESFNNNDDIDKKYFKMKSWWIQNFEEKFKNNPQVLCHNDLQNSNIIKEESSEKIYFIDFEYIGFNDLYYDIASFEENAIIVFENYFDKKINEEELFKIKFYQLYQCIQWYQVALYKEKIGFSKKTNYDFKILANYFLNKAILIYKEIRHLEF